MKNAKIGWLVVGMLLLVLCSTRVIAQESWQIRQAQERLKAAGFDPGPIDGLLGPRTKTALRQYQAAQGLPTTGVLDAATRKALGIQARAEAEKPQPSTGGGTAGDEATTLAKQKGDLALGESVYKEICFSCHGLKGDGKGPSWLNTTPRPQVFANPAYMSRFTDRYMYEVVKYGKLGVLKGEVPDSPLEAVAMPSFGDVLEDDQIRKLIELEHALLNGQEPPDPEIKAIFDEACAVCHGKGGRGDGDRAISIQPPPKRFISEIQPPPADYTNAELMARFSDDFRFWLIKEGRIGATEKKNFDTMKSYGHILSDKEIWSVIRYIRETFIEKDKE